MLPGADVLREDDLSRIGKAHDQKCEKVQNIAANGHRRQAGFTDKTADDDHIHHVVKGL